MKNSNLSHALKYTFDYGWSVFPIKKGSKAPLMSWKEFQKRKPTREEITKWWTANPDAGIAIVTGSISNLIVIDIDPRHGGTNESFRNIKTPTVRTGGGGWHIYVYFKNGVQNAVNIQSGIDIRGEGGYIIAPPTVHESGNPYEWIISPEEEKLVYLPKFVNDWIHKPKKQYQEKNNKDTQFARSFDESILEGVGEGKRNSSAASITGKLLTHFSRTDWDTFAWPLVVAWNKLNKPPLSESELKGIFSSIKNKAQNNPRTSQKSLHSSKEDTAMQWKEPVQITDLSEEQENIDWILEGFIAKGHATLISAIWKLGKTTFLLWLFKHLQTGVTFIGQSICVTKVLIISEESESIWASRKEKYEYQDGIFVVCRPVKSRLSPQEWIQFLEYYKEYCIKNDISVIVIDTIANFWPVKDENSASQVNDALLPLNDLLESNIAILLVHHDRKSGGSDGTASRGSGAFPGFVDIIIELKRFNQESLLDHRRTLKSLSRFDETPSEMVIELTDNGFISQGTVNGVRMDDKLEILYKILPEAPLGLTRTQICEKWPQDDASQPNSTTLFRWLKRLQKKEKVKIVGKGDEKGKPDLWGKCIALQQVSYTNATEKEEKNDLKLVMHQIVM